MIDVVIAGGGPTGLMLACELALAGARPVVLERLAEPGIERRANGLVGEVVRMMDRRGLYERLTGTPGAPEPVRGFVFGAFPLPLADLHHNLYTLPVPQRRIEEVLTERAAELGVDVRRGHEVTGLVQDEDAVTIEVGGREPVRARFLVGADGGHSVVRKLAGIGFPGVTSDEAVSYSADVSVPPEILGPDGELVVPGFGVVPPFQHLRTERGMITWAPFPGRNPTLNTMEWGLPADGEASLAEVRASAARMLGVDLPLGPPTDEGPHLMRRLFGGNTRIAERYRDRRVFLLGDAAHVHSAIGGPGLNLGLQDAVNLGWKLAAAVRGDVDVLDTYESERRPVAQRVAMHTQAQSLLLRPGGEVTAFRELFAELLALRGTRQHLADLLAGADIRYDMGTTGELVGQFAPDLVDQRDLTHSGRALLLDPTGLLDAAPWRKSVDVVEMPDLDCAFLLRPDCFVAWAGADQDGLHEALTRWFGPGTH
ncbi:FAD-dependent monooxygenase [Amycolatopsis thermalba]|uniref:FAD-dependent monooxygenase n=1 Tax=Amycolatopsis thermalba TaxID=944492 RepID=A0ABY4P305_9PSEU|nr:FAD-dependent monooxygenase [Amycolatopsis thermalba]UQS26737.1 FAD-dependent monooxygenase [Amycolatopsis thermalba]